MRARTSRDVRPGSAPRSVCRSASAATRSASCTRPARTVDRPMPEATGAVELIARKVGERVGMLRAFERSETQAHTDPLTGLMNRRSLEANVRELTESGHLVRRRLRGPRPLQATSTTSTVTTPAIVRCACSPGCCATPSGRTTSRARYGGEEFVVVLPDCSVDDAYIVVDRIRERLALAQVSGTVPALHRELRDRRVATRAHVQPDARGRGRGAAQGEGAPGATGSWSVVRAATTPRCPSRSTRPSAPQPSFRCDFSVLWRR